MRHLWDVWDTAPYTQRCRRCKLKRRLLNVAGEGHQYTHYMQQYKFPGSGWIRGHDGSLLFDHGGVPPCVKPEP